MRLKKAWGHFKTITRHRHQVMAYCYRAGIFWQGLRHDLSKYTPTEFLAGVRHYTDGKKSPNETERALYGYSSAWLHHKGRNRHHFEYWNDYNPQVGKVMPIKMPVRHLKELICDRVAASRIYQGAAYTDAHPLAYFLRGKDNRSIHPETSDKIEALLGLLAKEGEAALFSALRQMKDY